MQEYIDGNNLAQELEQQGEFSDSKILQLLIELLPVLRFIHNKNVIHRDIKPENIIRPRNKEALVLVDFGASKLVTAGRLNTANITANIGTSGYMAPEQSMGIQSFASDLYSLGVTCILLTNKKTSNRSF